MKSFLIATAMVTALLTFTSAQAEVGTMGKEGMRADTSSHHRLKGSTLHENAASAHTTAAKHHKLAASMYRKNKDASAVDHAKMALTASQDASAATQATKEILPE
ncbi:MAG: hypothetical protein K9L22_03310 [Methylococcaceae bacterium]|nr:hypothetical protein [Methylococcaceae bacterium]